MNGDLKLDFPSKELVCLVEDFSGSLRDPIASSSPYLILPDYQRLSVGEDFGGVNPDPQLSAAQNRIFCQIQRIIASEGLAPLLLELAVIRDRAESGKAGDSFVSHFACFADDSSGAAILKSWKSMVAVLVEQSPQGNYSRLDLVPNPRTYEYVYYAAQLNDSKSTGTRQTQPNLIQSEAYQLPNFVRTNGKAISLPDNMRRMALMLKRFDTDNLSLISSLPNLWIFVVPFFRVIEYAEAAVNLFWQNFGGRPGGCLIGLAQAQTTDERQLRLACIRLSWLLHKGAFVESDANAKEHRYRRDLLRKLSHAVQNPMISAKTHLDKIFVASARQQNIEPEVEEATKQAQYQFNAAFAATSCIDFFVHLGTGADSKARDEIITKIKSGHTRINSMLSSLCNEEFLSSKDTPLGYKMSHQSNRVFIEGASYAWWLVLYIAVKNASEASPSGGTIALDFSYNQQLERAEIIIENQLLKPLESSRLHVMNLALAGKINHIEPNFDKGTSLGLGIVTIGQILRAWNLRDCKYRFNDESNPSRVIFEIFDIPAGIH